MFKILTINPGSTSTKIAVFHDEKEFFITTLRHSVEELAPFEKIADQFDFRKNVILDELKKANIEINDLDVIIGRGGLSKPVESGVFEVNDKLKHDLIYAEKEHASNLGGLIARDIAMTLGGDVKAYIADPVVVDELSDVSRISGHPLFERISIFHALNQKAVARRHSKIVGKKYEDQNLIVVHLGGGISVGAHQKGRVVDVNQALDGEGPFSPERSGTLPVGDLVKLCFSGKYSINEVKEMVKGKGGYAAYLDTNNAKEVGERIEKGDEKAKLVQQAMIQQVAKEIGAMFTVLFGEVDGILLTGGIAYDKKFTAAITERVKKLGEVFVYPGEDEMEALAMNGLMVLRGELEPKVY